MRYFAFRSPIGVPPISATRHALVAPLALATLVAGSPAPAPTPTAEEPVAVTIADTHLALRTDSGDEVHMSFPRRRPSKESFVLRSSPIADGAATIIEIPHLDSPSRYRFVFELPRKWRLRAETDGSVTILDKKGQRSGTIAPPWATDSAGHDVSTHYEVKGRALIQHVDHAEAVHPVVADPSVTLGRNIYLWARGYEIGWWGSSSAAFLSTYMCAAWGSIHPVLCAVSAVGALWLITAFNAVFAGDRCRYVIALRYWGWPNYMERLKKHGCSYRKSEIPG